MIHIATVHWQTDRWIDIQLRYFERYIDSPYRVYACLTGPAAKHASRFHFVSTTLERDHPKKLNYLAQVAGEQAADEDLLLFFDGDAFPISDVARPLEGILAMRPLTAIRRDENFEDPQPHPSFCATTVGFWKEIGGDWARGYRWLNSKGTSVGDVGGNLLKILQDRQIEWTPLLRTNTRNLHPIWFGVYGNLVYHHGAGFRHPWGRRDRTRLERYAERLGVTQSLQEKTFAVLKGRRVKRNRRISDSIFERIKTEEDFPRDLFFGRRGVHLPKR